MDAYDPMAPDVVTNSRLQGSSRLVTGYVGDCLGRSKAMALTMALTVGGALLSCINVPFGEASPGSYVIVPNQNGGHLHFDNDQPYVARCGDPRLLYILDFLLLFLDRVSRS